LASTGLSIEVNYITNILSIQYIAENFTVFVTYPRNTKSRNLGKADKLRVFVNPKINFFSRDQHIIYEGCGCVPNLFGPVMRPKEIMIEAYNEKADRFSLSCDGILARVIQHEYDHLSGIEFIEKIFDYKKMTTTNYYRKNIKNSKGQLLASKITKIEYKKF